MGKYKFLMTLALCAALFGNVLQAQEEKTEKKEEGYVFKEDVRLKCTPPKNQFRSSTCWSYATIGMLESEIIRAGKGEHDLSEAFIVHKTYAQKANDYVRWNGSINFGPGGACHDVILTMKEYGIVPNEAMDGLVIDEENFVHSEMDHILKGYVTAVVKNPNKKLTPVWRKGYEGVLNAYLGEVPEEFEYNGKKYTPKSYFETLGLNMDDYKTFTSFTHHPFYEEFVLELPDNWMMQTNYNIPLDDMMTMIDEALDNNYTIAWASDVSEKGFSWKNGVAIVPDEKNPDVSGTDRDRWESMSNKEKTDELYKFDKPVKEKTITQELRQQGFDNYETTDDHGMQIVGRAFDQNGTKYYIVKNSWGTDQKYDGYFYASEAFVRYKTINITLNANAISKDLKKKIKY